MKLPKKGELVLVFDTTGNDTKFSEYAASVIRSGGRVRRVTSLDSLARHLRVYNPTFIICLKHEVDQ